MWFKFVVPEAPKVSAPTSPPRTGPRKIIIEQPKAPAPNLDRVELIKGYKKAMVKTMTKSLAVPTFSYCDEIDVTAITEMREKLKKIAEGQGVKFSYMPFFIKVIYCFLYRYFLSI